MKFTMRCLPGAAVAVLLAAAVAYGAVALDRADDDRAIAQGVGCILAKVAAKQGYPLAYNEELQGREYGEHVGRQLLADLRAKGTGRDAARNLLQVSACGGAPPAGEPLPLVSRSR